MTATRTRPEAPAAASPRPAMPPDRRERRPDHRPEVALVLVTVVATLAFRRLFDTGGVLGPLLLAVLTAHLVAAATRRRRFGSVATAAAMTLGLVVQASVVLYPQVSFLGLPTSATFSAAVDDLSQAWQLFGEVVAPAPTSRGFLLAITVALWATVALVDWAAFRLHTTAEAVIPALALFTFTAILGDGSGGVFLATLLASSILAFGVTQRVSRSAQREAWVGGQDVAGTSALVRVGCLLAVVCAVGAAIVGPQLPGAGREGLVDVTGGGGEGSRVTVSPLVDIRSRLVAQSDTVAFTVRADTPAYWRLTSLDRFDGQVWSSSGSFSRADGGLPSPPSDSSTTTLEQTFDIQALATIWAPAALTPVELGTSDSELRWNGELTTLIVPRARESIDDTQYTVTSEVPRLMPADLGASLPSPLPSDLAEATRLPPDITPEVDLRAREVTRNAAPTPYARALALQDWFRGSFTYDLAGTGAGHDEQAIEAFLRERRGYCEQFAGTFAAMARSLGIPARVAVGFTPGEVDEDGTTYTVRGRNAHAWPEVHIPGIGWVPFEPTPGRGQPGAEDYTGVDPTQDEAGSDATPTTTTTTTTTTPPANSDTPPPASGDEDLRSGAATAPEGGSGGGGGQAATPLRATLVAVAAIVAVLVIDVVGLAAVRGLRRRRRRRAGTVPGQVRAAWAESTEALSEMGLRPAASETDREFADRVAPDLGPDGPALVGLAGLVTHATWAPPATPPDPARADQAATLARRVTLWARDHTDVRQRLQARVDPRFALGPLRR